jgi:hypothetical protein
MDTVCFRNVCINTLRKGDNYDDNNNNNNNNNNMATDKHHQCHPQGILSQTNYMNV